MPVLTANGEEFHLSHDEEDKLNQFQSITDFKEEELYLIIKLLQNHSWHLEPALSRYFDGNWKESLLNNAQRVPTSIPAAPAIVPELGPRPTMMQQLNLNNTNNLIPVLPIVQRLPENYRDIFKVVGLNHQDSSTKVSTNPIFFILMLLPNALFKIVSLLWTLLTYGVMNNSLKDKKVNFSHVPKYPSVETNELDLSKIINKTTSGKDTSPILEKLNELVLKDRDVEFNDALKICETESKFLLVILIGEVNATELASGNEKDSKACPTSSKDIDINSQKLLRNILTDNGVLKILDDYKDDMIIYFRSVTELEPWLVARSLNITHTPEALLVANVLNGNGSMNGTTRLSVLSKLKINSPRRFQNSLKMTIDRYNPELVVSRTEKEELRMSREIKQLQEQAYLDSLRKDQLKEERKKIEQEEKVISDSLKLQKEEKIKLNATIQNLKWLQQCLHVLDNGNNTECNEKMATLQIRTSTGARIIKNFQSETNLHSIYCNIGAYLYLKNNCNPSDSKAWSGSIVQKMKELIEDDSVMCFKDLELVQDEMNTTELNRIINSELTKWQKENHSGEDISLSFDFELISPFPRYRVPADKNIKIRDVSQIWPNGSLLVEDIIESDEEANTSDECEDDD